MSSWDFECVITPWRRACVHAIPRVRVTDTTQTQPKQPWIKHKGTPRAFPITPWAWGEKNHLAAPVFEYICAIEQFPAAAD